MTAATLTRPTTREVGVEVNKENPWPGLHSFREEDTLFFCGRKPALRELLAYVDRARLTVLYAPSGLGKSSLLQAGLTPVLRERGVLPVHIRLDHTEGARPLRTQVLERLLAEASNHEVEAPATVEGETLWEHFHRRRNAYWSTDNSPVTPLLMFDQFEEAFTDGSATERKRATDEFLTELAHLVEGDPPQELLDRLEKGEADPADFEFGQHLYRVLFSIREDFLAHLETLKTRAPSVMTNRMELWRMNGEAALEVTAAGGDTLVPPPGPGETMGVGERIARLVAGEEAGSPQATLRDLVVDPALLSLFCSELNEKRKSEGRTSIAADDLVEGSRTEILDRYYQRSIGDLDPGVRRFVEDKLVTDDGRSRNSEDWKNALSYSGVSAAALNELIGRRLLRPDTRVRRARSGSCAKRSSGPSANASGPSASARWRKRVRSASGLSASARWRWSARSASGPSASVKWRRHARSGSVPSASARWRWSARNASGPSTSASDSRARPSSSARSCARRSGPRDSRWSPLRWSPSPS